MEDKSWQFIVVATALWVIAFILGFWGYYLLDANKVNDYSDYVYEALQLFGLKGEWELGEKLPWQHEVARFLAPFLTIFTVIFAFVTKLKSRIKNAWASTFYTKHIVVLGLGTKGSIIAQSFLADGYKVIAIEIDERNDSIVLCRRQGGCVFVGSALSPHLLKKMRLAKAEAFFAVCDTAAQNIEINLLIRNLNIPTNKDNPLIQYIHTSDSILSERLERSERLRATNKFDLRFFNIFENSARMLFNKYPPEFYADVFDAEKPHLVVFGFSELGQNIVLEAVTRCHYINQKQLKITVVDSNLAQLKKQFFSRYSHVNKACDLDFIEIEPSAVLPFETLLNSFTRSDLVTGYIVCELNAEIALSNSLYLHEESHKEKCRNAPIFVYMSSASGLMGLLESNVGRREIPDNLFAFGLLREVLSAENLIDEKLDEIPHLVHESYLKERRQESKPENQIGTKPADHEWKALSSYYKGENRKAGDHLVTKLRALRAQLVTLKVEVDVNVNSDKLAIAPDIIDILAQVEHRRWMACHYLEGWQYASTRNDAARTHPDLVPWNKLSELAKKYDRNQINLINQNHGMLNNKSIVKDLYLGVISDAFDLKETLIQIREKLDLIKEDNPNRNYIVLCSVANIAEQQIVDCVIKSWGAKLIIPLPLPYALYKEDFPVNLMSESRSESEKKSGLELFTDVIGLSEHYYEMPLRFGTIHTLLPGTLARKQQYELAMAHIVERCDYLFLVKGPTDNQRTKGVSDWLNKQAIPEEYVSSMRYFFKENKHPANNNIWTPE